jgi:RNA polymerase sigma-70 factor (ECF subfamily)
MLSFADHNLPSKSGSDTDSFLKKIPTSPEVDAMLRELWNPMRAYAITLAAGDILLAEEILQESAIRIWEQRAMLPEIRNLRSWAFRVIYYKAHVLRRKRANEITVGFSEEVMELVSNAAEKRADGIDEDRLLKGLLSCMSGLNDEEKSLLSGHYEEHCSFKEIARRTGKTEDAVYKQISRLRRALRRCVEKKMSDE